MRKLTIAFFKAGLLEKKRILSYSSEKCTTFFKKSWFGYLENQLIFLPIESKYLQFFFQVSFLMRIIHIQIRTTRKVFVKIHHGVLRGWGDKKNMP